MNTVGEKMETNLELVLSTLLLRAHIGLMVMILIGVLIWSDSVRHCWKEV